MSDILYHYTSMNTLNKIFNRVTDENLLLRATEIRYLNDVSENEIAAEILVKELLEYEKKLTKAKSKNIRKYLTKDKIQFFKRIEWDKLYPFIFSLCEDSDSLPMWNTYADNALGIAIGFNKESLKDLGKELKLKRCDYKQAEIKKYISENIDKIYDSLMIDNFMIGITGDFNNILWGKFIESVPVLKHHTFNYEKEWRLIIDKEFDISDTKQHFEDIHFNISNSLPKPYIEFQLHKSFIREIVIGPCANFDLVKASLFMMIKKIGLTPTFEGVEEEKVNIKVSECPYRII